MIQLLKAFAAGTFNPEGSIYIFTTSGLQLFGPGEKKKQTYAFNTDQFLVSDGRKHSKSVWMNRFMIDGVKKIDSGEFLAQFVYFEAVTLHLLALKESQSLEQYLRLQKSMASISLYERVKLLSSHYIEESRKPAIKKINSILELRNQVAHVLKPSFIKYDNKYYPNDDPAFVSKIKAIMWDAMGALVVEYEKEQSTIATWITEIDAKTPEYVEIKNAADQVLVQFGSNDKKSKEHDRPLSESLGKNDE